MPEIDWIEANCFVKQAIALAQGEPTLTAAAIRSELERLGSVADFPWELMEVGKSVAGVPINLVSVGNGARRVVAWSQMHGDEPTHTFVLIALLQMLVERPDHALSGTLLEGMTLSLVPLVNPDGAALGTRRNLQDLDINRDARDCATPEGRALTRAIDHSAAEFAFNLHNQYFKSAVAGGLDLATISLLVPPLDVSDPETPQTRAAKQVAACFLDGVRQPCRGGISRYVDEYTPRAFGEVVQSRQISTLLVEAGGWQGHSAEDVSTLHLIGLLSALSGIATGVYATKDKSEYEKLPPSSGQDFFDLVVRNVSIRSPGEPAPFSADLGIDFPRQIRFPVPGTARPVGKVADLGDLRMTSGCNLIEEDELTCFPGTIAWHSDFGPERLSAAGELLAGQLAAGVTTLLGSIDPQDEETCATFAERDRQVELPIHVGFLLLGERLAADPTAADYAQLCQLIGGGVAGIVGDREAMAATWWGQIAEHLQVPVIAAETLVAGVATDEGAKTGWEERAKATWDLATVLGWKSHAAICRGSGADLQLVGGDDQNRLRYVIVGGRIAWHDGHVVEESAGRLVGRTIF